MIYFSRVGGAAMDLKFGRKNSDVGQVFAGRGSCLLPEPSPRRVLLPGIFTPCSKVSESTLHKMLQICNAIFREMVDE